MPQKLVTATVAGGPVNLASGTTSVNAAVTTVNYRTLKVVACKGLGGPTASPNTGRVNVGGSGSANQQPFDLTPGMERSFDAAAGKQEDMTKWWLSVQNDGDGVVVIWS